MHDNKHNYEKQYRCPVCGFPGLDEVDYVNHNESWQDFVWSYDICSCCGTEFGYDVDGATLDEVKRSVKKRRVEWIKDGHKWFSTYRLPPSDWDWKKELQAIGIDVDS